MALDSESDLERDQERRLAAGFPAFWSELNIDRREWAWLALIVTVALLLSSLPMIGGYLAQDGDWVFNGAVYDRQDYAVHLATMRLGEDGAWTYHLLFTTEPHPAKAVKLFYIFLGQLAAFFGLDIRLMFEIARLVLGAMTLVLIYIFSAYAFQSRRLRLAALGFSVFGSGAGWLMLLLSWTPQVDLGPIDFWLIDPYVFFNLVTFPHFLAVLVLILICAIAYTNYLQTSWHGAWMLCLFASLLIIPIQPFAVAVADLTMGAAVLASWRCTGRLEWRSVIRMLILIGLQLPLVYMNWQVFNDHPIWRQFSAQNITLSPPPIYYLWGVGLLGPFALWGGWLAWKERNSIGVLATVWLLGASLLLYAPTPIQRRFGAGLMIPIGILTSLAIGRGLIPWLARKWPGQVQPRRSLILMLAVVLSTPSTLYLGAGGWLFASLRPEALFDRAQVIRAAQWLESHATKEATVLTPLEARYVVPSISGLAVFAGHPIETIAFERKAQLVESFYDPQGMSDEERRVLLREARIDWVFWLGAEGEIEPRWLESLDSLQMRFQDQPVVIYSYGEP